METILSLCSGNAINERIFYAENQVKSRRIIFHDILYEKNNELIEEVRSLWEDTDILVLFTYDLDSLKAILGNEPQIDLLLGFNIQELYMYPPKTSLFEMREIFEREFRRKSLYLISKYLESSRNFYLHIQYHTGEIENSFKNFLQDRKKTFKLLNRHLQF